MSELTVTPATQAEQKCDCLRSKASFGLYGEGFEHLDSATTTYWCLKTMGKAGPDEHYVHGSLCRSGRSCYESPDEA